MSVQDHLSPDVATRIAEVVEAELRKEVAEARRRLDAEVDARLARLREMTDGLLERAARVSDELDGLAAALRDAATDAVDTANAPLGAGLAGDPGSLADPDDAEPFATAAPTTIDAPEAELGAPGPESFRPTIVARPGAADDVAPTPEPEPAATAEPPSDAARLVAVEMALAGSSRDDVDRHLRSAYDVADTGDLLDDVFGR